MSRLTINGKTINAPVGATLVDAALQGGVVLPQDCCTGQCGTCRVDVISGAVDAAGTAERNSVLACQARLQGDAEIHFDPVPLVMKTGGIVTSVRDLAGEIVEVVVEVTKPVPYLPGQYVKVEFAGFPARDYSPTLTLDGLREINQLIFHIRRIDDGIVSAALGSGIVPGSKVKVRGPFGHAFLRQGEGRIVLISTGTGFAPSWSIAVAARLGQPYRPLVMIASARDPRNLYMRPALDWLTKQGVNDIVLTASGANPLPPARHGRATDFLPTLSPADTVFACGSPEMIEEVKRRALTAGAAFYANPFLPSSGELPLGMKIKRFFTGAPKKTSPVHAQLDALAAQIGNSKS
ncbi:MAG: ferredoxin [Rhizobiales bacterium PAR1]|nr:MAG: ferredoxin [Rhizobiales bacterium PAR1]